MLAASEQPATSSTADDNWREEQDLDVILREIRRATWVYLYTDFAEAIRVSKKTAIEIVTGTRRAIEAGICTSASGRNSVFIRASNRRFWKTDPLPAQGK